MSALCILADISSRPDNGWIAQRRPRSEGFEQSPQPSRSCGQGEPLRNRRSKVRILSGASPKEVDSAQRCEDLRRRRDLPNSVETAVPVLKPNRTIAQRSPRTNWPTYAGQSEALDTASSCPLLWPTPASSLGCVAIEGDRRFCLPLVRPLRINHPPATSLAVQESDRADNYELNQVTENQW